MSSSGTVAVGHTPRPTLGLGQDQQGVGGRSHSMGEAGLGRQVAQEVSAGAQV